MAGGGTYRGNIVTSYLGDTGALKGPGSPPEHSHDDFDEIVMFFGTDAERPHELCGEVEWWMGGAA